MDPHTTDTAEASESPNAAIETGMDAAPERTTDHKAAARGLTSRLNPVQWLLLGISALAVCYWLAFPSWIGVVHTANTYEPRYEIHTISIFATTSDQWFATPEMLTSLTVSRILVTIIMSTIVVVLASLRYVAKAILYLLLVGMLLLSIALIMLLRSAGGDDMDLFVFFLVVAGTIAAWSSIIWANVTFHRAENEERPCG